MLWNAAHFLISTRAPAAALLDAATAPTAEDLPFRQAHLDFHTSELIPGVAADLDARQFLATLQSARVNSINVFAKCHHGYAYYDTKIAAKHPSLQIDLLAEMLRVCRPAGIRANYYYSLVWDVLAARRHPEWRCLDSDGKAIEGGIPWLYWPWICMNTPYLDQVVAENQEIVARYEVDGGVTAEARGAAAAGAAHRAHPVLSADAARAGFRVPRRPRAVALVPQKKPLAFRYEDGCAHVEISRVNGHQAIVFE